MEITLNNNLIIAGIGIIFLLIGIGIGYVLFSTPCSTNQLINTTKIVAIDNFSINSSKLNLQKTGNATLDTIFKNTTDNKTNTTSPTVQNKTNTTTAAPVVQNITKTEKPKVELFVMSYCPFGTQAEKGIIPVKELLKDKIDFSIKFVYYIMHGQKEIDENTVQYCIQKEQNDKFIKYLACFLNNSNSSNCISTTGVNVASLNVCINATNTAYNITGLFNDKTTWLSGKYPKYPIHSTENTKYGVRGSPGLVINGVLVQSGRAPATLLNTICNAFITKPEECNNSSLSTVNPSAGFGYTNAGDSGAAAQCGS